MKETRKIETLKEWDKNPRSLSKEGFERLKKQITKLGVYKPLLITKDGTVLGGNMRLKALQDLGYKDIWVSVVEADTEEKKIEYALSDNDRVGKYEGDQLADLIGNFPEVEWNDYAVDIKEPQLVSDLMDQYSEVVEDEVPEVPKVAESKLGEVYTLGRHRLMCGDATKIEDVEKLMDGKKADMVFTSPPYNVGINYEQHNDNLSQEQYNDLITKSSKNCFDVMNEGRLMAWNVGVSPKSRPHNHLNILELNGFNLYRHIVWKKTGAQIPLWQNSIKDPRARHYMPNYNHELIYIMSKGELEYGNKTIMPDELSMDVWDVSQFTAGGKGHPAAFPVKLANPAIKVMTSENEIVLDIFGGSGSTLIACEQTNRTCYMMELDPLYVDVIRKRYKNYIDNNKKQ